jgi:hypothetical protein
MARVFLARVDELDDVAAAAAIDRGLDWLGLDPARIWSCVRDPWEGERRETRALGRTTRAALVVRGGETRRVRALPRGTGCARYQLTVGAPGEQLEAHEDLYTAGPIFLMARLELDLAVGGPGGALAAMARALLPRPLDTLDETRRLQTLGGLCEVADPDLVVGDGRRVSVGASHEQTQTGALGLVLVADNALAHDLVWAEILGVDPEALPWPRRLAELGFGPGRLDEVTLGGDPLAFFARRVEGLGRPARALAEVPGSFLRTTGVPLPIQVLPAPPDAVPGPAAARAHAWLSAHTEHPVRREALKLVPPFALLAGPREPGALPQVDRLLTVGPEAAAAILADVHITRAKRVSPWLAIVRGSSAEIWRLDLSDGRRLRLAALTDPAPSVARIGRAAAVLCGVRSLAWPRESRVVAIVGWIVRRLRRDGLPPPLVHARRIRHLQDRSWRAARLLGPPLRETDHGA